MDFKAFQSALEQLEAEKGIKKEKILEAIELALAAAYKKEYAKRGQIITAKFDPSTGKATFSQIKIAVDPSMIKIKEEEEGEDGEPAEKEEEAETEEKKIYFNPERHIMLEEARKIKKDIKPGEEIIFPLEPKEDYGRIAAQTAKQVILQNIREAEKESLFDEFKNKEGEIISGTIQRIEGFNIFLDLGKITAILPREEQVKNERYRIGERIKAYVYLVEKTPRGLSIFLSRTHPRFVIKLFEMEVPEILNEVVEIKFIAREPGARSKIAVYSNTEGIDPVGSCVGQKGVRVNTVINELGGEKLDIIEYSENPEVFIKNAIAPAKVLDVEANTKNKEAKILADEDQLSLAIGKNGQNVRLAAKLTGYRIDIKSRSGKSVISANETGVVEENPEAEHEKDEHSPEEDKNPESAEKKDEVKKEKKREKTENKKTEKKAEKKVKKEKKGKEKK